MIWWLMSLLELGIALALPATSDPLVGRTKWLWVERGLHLNLGGGGGVLESVWVTQFHANG